MRNLKRALSLTLASVMLLGMMVVGSSAAGYPDVTEEENIEAIEVLQSVGVMEGDNNGNFNPDDYVTREQMAVIMSKLLNLDYNYYQGTNPFSDVPAWAAPYVAACAANGITSGIGGGMYGAGQNVNAVQAALMMLKALGYFQYQQDFGDDYVLATVKQATEVGMFAQIDSKAEQALTRNEVAQMALNALQSDLVRFTGDPGVKYTGSNGESWIGGYKAEYTPRTSTDPKYNRLIDNKHSSDIDHSGQYYCQLGEELYNGNLVKRIDSDIFERPAYTWTYKTEKIGTYMDKAKLEATYTSGVSGRTLYDLLNNITIRDYDLDVYVDGHEAGNNTTDYAAQYGTDYKKDSTIGANEIITAADLKRSNTDSVGITGDGVLTQVFLDRDNEVITITSIHTWLAQATSSYSEAKENAPMKVFMTTANGTSKTVSVEEVPEVTGVAADNFYLVQMSDKDTSKLEVVEIAEPEALMESTVTKFTAGEKGSAKYPTKLTTDGTEYKKSDRAVYDDESLREYDADLLARSTYNVYLDKYGYFIGVDLHEGEKQYVFVTGYDMRNSNLSIQTASAAGIFLDGTMKNITVDVRNTNKNIKNMVQDKTTGADLTTEEKNNANAYYQQWGTNKSDGVYLLNRWYTYSVDSNNVYTLKPCVDKYGVAMMLAAKTDDAGSDDDTTLKLNCAKLRLDSVTNSGTSRDGDLLMGESMTYTTTELTGVRAYGEDESVFITVDVDEVSASAGGSTNANKLAITKAITDVNGVYTGVQDVDIVTETADRVVGKYYVNNTDKGDGTTEGTIGSTVASADNDTYNGTQDTNGHWVAKDANYSYVGENAYAVFDKNNFIIGAVILGEAEGNNATKAYILDPVKYERYENGTYYWQFEAVINGEIVTQEAESKYVETINTMKANRYEVVELRYNAAGDVVTDVKAIERTDGAAVAPTYGKDKIYGYPFAEIMTYNAVSNPAGHKVNDNESIYDVVLTGADNVDGTAGVHDFQFVTRPRTNLQHTSDGVRFTTTQIGTLSLQGRTLYVDASQHDYGIDFVRDAKAVVIQREGILGGDTSKKVRAYNSVQEAIDSMGDADKTSQNTKEFEGIITAVLNSQGVAEWVVFYSDTVAETKTNINDPSATMKVRVKYKLVGTSEAEATEYGVVEADRIPGTNLAQVPSPDTHSGRPILGASYTTNAYQNILWEPKADPIKVVVFSYSPVGEGEETPSAGTKTVRVQYVLKADYNSTAGSVIKDKILGTTTADVALDAAGYGTLKATDLKSMLNGYEIDSSDTSKTDLGGEVVKGDTPVTMTVAIKEKAVKSIALKSVPANPIWVKYKATGASSDFATAADDAGVKVEITYADDTTRTIDADATGVTWTDAATANGNTKATYATKESGNLAFKVYGDISTTVTLNAGITDWTAVAESGKTTKDGTVLLTFTAANNGATTETAVETFLATLKDKSTGGGITLDSFTFKEITVVGDGSTAAKFTAEVAITYTGAPTSDTAVGLKITTK